jgi:hypothetical protein
MTSYRYIQQVMASLSWMERCVHILFAVCYSDNGSSKFIQNPWLICTKLHGVTLQATDRHIYLSRTEQPNPHIFFGDLTSVFQVF